MELKFWHEMIQIETWKKQAVLDSLSKGISGNLRGLQYQAHQVRNLVRGILKRCLDDLDKPVDGIKLELNKCGFMQAEGGPAFPVQFLFASVQPFCLSTGTHALQLQAEFFVSNTSVLIHRK